jgi:RHS repeat-associated protein
VKVEFIWLMPEVTNDNAPFGGGDGVDGYAPLAVALAGGVIHWVHGNHLGVPQATTDAAGALQPNGGDYQLPGFPGQSRTFADLYYNRHRDYDPSTGRYIQADPIGLDGGDNLYLYAQGNPVRYTDPSGEFVPFVPIVVGIGIGVGLELGQQALGNWWKGRRILDADCYDWSAVGVAGLLGGAGGGAGGKYALRYASNSFTRVTAREWSHGMGYLENGSTNIQAAG